jgi:hypothetical protein
LRFDADYERERGKLLELFRGLRHRPPLGIYMVDGDVDPDGRGLPEVGVRLLRDETVQLASGSRLQIVGLRPESSRLPLDARDVAGAHGFAGLTVVMGHAPDFVASLLRDGITTPLLCIAGHTHGGQLVVPLLGPLITLSRLPRRYAGGLHRIGAAWLVVSRGIGMERGYAPRIRMFCPPELVVLELRPTGSAKQER